MSLYQFISTLESCESINSRKEKEALLTSIKDNRFLEVTARLVFDPFVTLGVTAAQMDSEIDTQTKFETEDQLFDSFKELISLLSRRALTGNAALQRIASFQLSITSLNTRMWFTKFLNNEFVTGVGPTTIAKVFPDLKLSYGVQLASPFKDFEFLTDDSTWVAEPKMDGYRCIMFKDQNGTLVALSRNLKEIYFPNVSHIAEELAPLFDEGYVVDGEILATNWNDTSSIASTKFEHPNRLSLNFHVFDLIRFTEFLEGGSALSQRQRSKALSLFFAQKNEWKSLVRVTQHIVKTEQEVKDITKQFVTLGYEGSVVKNLDASYQGNHRAPWWIKIKPVETEDVIIIGAEAGEKKYSKKPSKKVIEKCAEKYDVTVEQLSSLECSLGSIEVSDSDGTPCGKIGSGMSDIERVYFMWLHNNNQLIGKTVEAEFQERTLDKNQLRFGVFKRLRLDK